METKIILFMIVKNESNIIIRCLEQVKNICQAFAICDTGSTDDTVEKVNSFLKDNSLEGKIFYHE